MNPSTVKFLLDNHMDFDKVLREGVSCVTVDEANTLKRHYFERYNADADAAAPAKTKANGVAVGAGVAAAEETSRRTGSDRVRLTKIEDIAFVARAMAGLREWIDSDNVPSSTAVADNADVDDNTAAAVDAMPYDADTYRFANVRGDAIGTH